MDPIDPASPIPFTPSGFTVVGVCVVAVSNEGRSAALGIGYVARFDVIGLPSSS